VPIAFTPFVLGAFDREVYALWAVLMTVIGILQNTDMGVTSVMQRFHSHYRGVGDEAAARRLTGSVMLAVVALAIVLGALGPLVAQLLVGVIHPPAALVDDALALLRPAGLFAGLQLIALALTGYLGGHARFGAAALSSLGARAVLAAMLVLTLTLGWGVTGLVLASAADAIVAVLLAVAATWRHLVGSIRSLLSRAELREVWAFAWRSQLSTAGFLAQRELDVLLATLLLPLPVIGAVAAGAQSSIAVSLFPTIFLVPLVTRIGYAAGRDRALAIATVHEADAEWRRLYPVYAGVVLGVLGPAVAAWVGPALPLSPVLAVLIAAGMMAFLPGFVLVLAARALGRPGVETSAYVVLVAVKIVLGVAGALLFGPIGLAASTVFASIAAQIVLARRARALDPELRLRAPSARILLLAIASLALAAGGAFGLAAVIPWPFPRLIAIAVWAALLLGGGVLLARRTDAR
jgi:O-antigen/teichoic acid export membrane protein